MIRMESRVERAQPACPRRYDGRLMTWLRGIVGILCVLIGLVWLGQGTNLLPGSFMTGQTQWAIIGLVLLVLGAWLLWGLVQRRRAQ